MANANSRLLTPAAVAVAGLLSLAVAMGIGRFAFTPLLPLMVSDRLVTVAEGGWLAAANYVGYFVGALIVSRVRIDARRLAIVSLIMIACTTAGMAVPGAIAWAILRFLSGVFSAWVFVATSVWCLGALAQMRRAELGAWVYCGVGVGIALAGLACLVAAVAGIQSQMIWVQLGVLAAALTAPVIFVLRAPLVTKPVTAGQMFEQQRDLASGTKGLVICYGIMGFGYILPGTFLPVLARAVVTDPSIFGWAWPVFGATAAASTLIAGVVMRRLSRLQIWAGCQALMSIGAFLPSVWPHAAAILLAAFLVGGTFMVITLAGVQEIRARVSWNPSKWVGYLTASFGVGQIVGPVVSSVLLLQPELADRALEWGLQLAALFLMLSAAWLWRHATPSSSINDIAHVK